MLSRLKLGRKEGALPPLPPNSHHPPSPLQPATTELRPSNKFGKLTLPQIYVGLSPRIGFVWFSKAVFEKVKKELAFAVLLLGKIGF